MRAVADRFWKKADRSGGPDACWPWRGARNRKGYGRFNVEGANRHAHRVAYALAGSDPGDLCVLHRCDNPACVNPGHLFLGTNADNNRDMCQKGRARPCRGSQNGRAKLTEHDVREIRRLHAAGHGCKRLARQFGVSAFAVLTIFNGQGWRHVA